MSETTVRSLSNRAQEKLTQPWKHNSVQQSYREKVLLVTCAAEHLFPVSQLKCSSEALELNRFIHFTLNFILFFSLASIQSLAGDTFGL